MIDVVNLMPNTITNALPERVVFLTIFHFFSVMAWVSVSIQDSQPPYEGLQGLQGTVPFRLRIIHDWGDSP